jgi:hypothetical protein
MISNPILKKKYQIYKIKNKKIVNKRIKKTSYVFFPFVKTLLNERILLKELKAIMKYFQ